MIQFDVGQSYGARLNRDAYQQIHLTVAKRTAKTITTTDGATMRVRVFDGAEFVMPEGRYSMAPTVSANSPTGISA